MSRANDYYDWPLLYEVTSPGVPGDIQFYLQEAKRLANRGPVLELGSGLGRISLALARHGIDVVGIEASPAMLAEARRRLASLQAEVAVDAANTSGHELKATQANDESGSGHSLQVAQTDDGPNSDYLDEPQPPAPPLGSVEYLQGDMRDFHLNRTFPLAIIPYRAFLHCLTQEDQLSTLLRVREHLQPGGHLLLDFFTPDLELIANEDSSLHFRGEFVEPNSEPARRFLLWEATQFDRLQQRVDDHLFFDFLGPDGTVVRRTEASFSIRYIFPSEFRLLLLATGFRLLWVYGGFHREPLSEDSVDTVWLARRS
ncbi:MAG: class I SAM-dependent methyltransferase [Limnochordaceae bacterium]|nr:class I SAM-dependent methyltransferase [Limnochordaceae bacterium]